MNGNASGSPSTALNGQSPSKSQSGNASGPPPGFRSRARRPPPPANPLAATQSTRRPPPGARPNGNTGAMSNSPRPQHQQQNPNVEEYEEIPILTTKRSLINGQKHHVLRFHPAASADEQNVNLFSEAQFERPVRLHRRDPAADPLGNVDDSQEGGEEGASNKTVDEKERERIEKHKADRQQQREADQQLIAPTTKSQTPKKDNRRGGQQFVHSFTDNVNKQKNMAIRYEEKLPWHVEDFENKQTWRGFFESNMSETFVALVEGQDATGRKVYHALPMQKWYKLLRKNQYKKLAWRDANAAMEKHAPDPLWIRKARVKEEKAKVMGADRDAAKGIFARKSDRGELGGGGRIKFEEDDQPEAALDADDIDFNAEEDFADDEEGPAPVGKDEEDEMKETTQRVKKEQLEANVFEVKDQKDWDAEEEAEKRKHKAEKKHRKRMRKALQEREKNFDFDEESEEDDSSDDSDDSEIERLKEEEKRVEEERKAGGAKNDGKDKVVSGTSTARTGTPNPLRPSKLDDPRRKVLKRAGSPGLSEASGNESSSRKKMKQKHGSSALAANGATISRPGSPANGLSPNVVAPAPQRPGMKVNLDASARQSSPLGAGSGSDVEMSDGGSVRTKKKGSGNTSPRGSRPGSPDGVQAVKKAPAATAPLNLEVIKESIPKQGIGMSAFVQLPNIKAFTRHGPEFMKLLKANADFDPAKKMLYPKGHLSKTSAPATPSSS